jgi:hypothetical protein
MRLAMPDSVRAGLEALASALPCIAGVCEVPLLKEVDQ